MSTYELDDELVQAVIEQDWTSAQMDQLTDALRTQKPLPIPTKIGAVVRASYNDGLLARWTTDEVSDTPWIDTADGELLPTRSIGRIIKTHSEGVDL